MKYADRIKRVANTLDELIVDGLSQKVPDITEHMGNVLTHEVAKIHDMALELDETPRASDGGKLILIAFFPYPHPEDRDRMRLALYNKPCPSGDGSGEYIIWSECREYDHDGFREASRNWGIYQGYVKEDHDDAFAQMLDKFSYKCARIVGPHVPQQYRGYRRSEG